MPCGDLSHNTKDFFKYDAFETRLHQSQYNVEHKRNSPWLIYSGYR